MSSKIFLGVFAVVAFIIVTVSLYELYRYKTTHPLIHAAIELKLSSDHSSESMFLDLSHQTYQESRGEQRSGNVVQTKEYEYYRVVDAQTNHVKLNCTIKITDEITKTQLCQYNQDIVVNGETNTVINLCKDWNLTARYVPYKTTP